MTVRAAGARDPGVSVEVAVAGCLFAGTGGIALVLAFRPTPAPATTVVLAAAPVLALAAGVVLDHRPHARLGRAFLLLSSLALLEVAWALIRFGPVLTETMPPAVAGSAALLLVSFAIVLPWSVCPPAPLVVGGLGAAVAVTGAVVVTSVATQEAAGPHDNDAIRVVGWTLCVVGSIIAWTAVGRSGRRARRTDRRRLGWTFGWVGLVVAVFVTSAAWWGAESAGVLTGLTVIAAVVGLTRLEFVDSPRPLDEVALDLALVTVVAVVAIGVGLLVGLGSRWTGLLNPATWTAYGAVVAVAIAAPGALAVRRSVLAARYGRGVIAPTALAAIAADLRAQDDPRELLDKAAGIVATASRSHQARIVLGPDEPDLLDGWWLFPLLVGADRVGSLIVSFRGVDGPEARQRRAIGQLLPTVALVARAVSLAVETELARRDVARERVTEQQRILRDLHDGLGPALAGMSMRVRAALRTGPPPVFAQLLDELATELAAVRSELRGIVAGLTPSALDRDDLGTAVRRLVDTFRGSVDGVGVGVDVDLDRALPRDTEITVYRSVAEGITNALRHAAASNIQVRVCGAGGRVVVEVQDDGVGGGIVPGVGLSSLTHRAEAGGGGLLVGPGEGGGTVLRLWLPDGPRAEAVA